MSADVYTNTDTEMIPAPEGTPTRSQEEADWIHRQSHSQLYVSFTQCIMCLVPLMLCRLSPPLGLGPTASSTDVLRFVFDLDIPLINGRVPFQRTAYELVRRCSGAEIPQGILKDQVRTMEQPPGVISTNKGDVEFSVVLLLERGIADEMPHQAATTPCPKPWSIHLITHLRS